MVTGADGMKSQLHDLVAGVPIQPRHTTCLPYVRATALSPAIPMKLAPARYNTSCGGWRSCPAKRCSAGVPDDNWQAAMEQPDQAGHPVSDLTRRQLAEALNPSGRGETAPRHIDRSCRARPAIDYKA